MVGTYQYKECKGTTHLKFLEGVMADNMVIVSVILPLVLLLVPVLLTTYRYPLATASEPDHECELCTNGPASENHIKLKYPAISSGQILVCYGGYWRTVCDDQGTYNFSDTDASVACYQLGFTLGRAKPGRGVEDGCLPSQVYYFIAVEASAPCKIWAQNLSQCLKQATNDKGRCSLETTASVICNGWSGVRVL